MPSSRAFVNLLIAGGVGEWAAAMVTKLLQNDEDNNSGNLRCSVVIMT